MSGTFALKQKDFYGAFELKKLYPRNYTLGLAVAIFLHIVLIGFYYFYQTISAEAIRNKPIRIIPYGEIGTPPPIDIPIQMPSSAHVAPLTNGIPVPAPVDQVLADQTIPTQDQLKQQSSTLINENNDAGNVIITKPITVDRSIEDKIPDPDIFIKAEKYPEMVVASKPVYPEVAIRSGITGKVYVKVLVDKEGKPRKAVVIKTDSDLFNQAAIDAAMKSAFTPAIQNHQPIAVWTILPYRFQLQE